MSLSQPYSPAPTAAASPPNTASGRSKAPTKATSWPRLPSDPGFLPSPAARKCPGIIRASARPRRSPRCRNLVDPRRMEMPMCRQPRNGTSVPPGGVTDPERGYGWLAAVLPADARRFRVADPVLADVLRDAGAELTDVTPDVEIAEVGQLRGDAAVSIAVLGRPRSGDASFPVRAGRRLVGSVRVRVGARYARRVVRRLGFSTVLVFTWDQHQTLRS